MGLIHLIKEVKGFFQNIYFLRGVLVMYTKNFFLIICVSFFLIKEISIGKYLWKIIIPFTKNFKISLLCTYLPPLIWNRVIRLSGRERQFYQCCFLPITKSQIINDKLKSAARCGFLFIKRAAENAILNT